LHALHRHETVLGLASQHGNEHAKHRWLIVAASAATLLLFVADATFAARAPIHIRLESSGVQAALTIDGEAHAFSWPSEPRSLSIAPNDRYVHDWAIDGSQTLNAALANLDSAYLKTLDGNPYIAFDRWLRGEDNYDHWSNLRLLDMHSGRSIHADIDAFVGNQGVALPPRFVFDGDIYHLEQPVTLLLTVPSGSYQIHLDRSGRQVTVTNNAVAGTLTIGQWYFPTDALPWLAINVDMVAHGAMWAILLLLASILLGAAIPQGWQGMLLRARYWSSNGTTAVTGIALLVAFGLMLYIALFEYNGNPHIIDGQGYYFQGKLLASGHLSLPLPPSAAQFPLPFFGVIAGHLVSQYSPGTAMTLALGFLVGLPWLVQPVLGLATLILVRAIAVRLYNVRIATIAVVLGALSPFLLFQVGSYFSHVQAAFFITLSYYLLVQANWGLRPWLTAGAGAALGMAFLCRELSALLVAPSLTVCLVAHLWSRRYTQGWRIAWPAIAWAVGGALFATIYVLYNWHITGDPLLSPRGIVDPTDRYGFGPGHGWWPTHTVAAGLINTDQSLTGLILDLFGWPYYMALAVPLLPFVLGRATWWDILNAAMIVSVVVGMIGYFYHGIAIGPRYYYEVVPALLILSARGIDALGDATTSVLVRLRRVHVAGSFATLVVLIALMAPNVLFYLPRHLELFRQYTAIAWLPNLPLSHIYATAPRHAIIVSSDATVYNSELAALNNPADLMNPATTDGTVWALASPPTAALYAQLSSAYPHRTVYLLNTDGATPAFQPWQQANR